MLSPHLVSSPPPLPSQSLDSPPPIIFSPFLSPPLPNPPTPSSPSTPIPANPSTQASTPPPFPSPRKPPSPPSPRTDTESNQPTPPKAPSPPFPPRPPFPPILSSMLSVPSELISAVDPSGYISVMQSARLPYELLQPSPDAMFAVLFPNATNLTVLATWVTVPIKITTVLSANVRLVTGQGLVEDVKVRVKREGSTHHAWWVREFAHALESRSYAWQHALGCASLATHGHVDCTRLIHCTVCRPWPPLLCRSRASHPSWVPLAVPLHTGPMCQQPLSQTWRVHLGQVLPLGQARALPAPAAASAAPQMVPWTQVRRSSPPHRMHFSDGSYWTLQAAGQQLGTVPVTVLAP